VLPPACPACGDALPPAAQFCPGCGRAVKPLTGATSEESSLGPRTDKPLVAAMSHATETDADITEIARFLPARYQPLKKLGQGGMGTVYQCMDRALERLVAIKIMTERYQSDPQGERRFMREARAQAIVNHPNVATVLNFGVSPEGRLFLVMEYLEGQDLRTILRAEKAIEPLRACDLMRQACDGLHDAHGAGLVHRDLKPSNVMIVKDSRGGPWVKILDLGLAKIVGGQTDLKSITMDTAGMLIGTPAYMSPEQVAGAMVDGRADLYSLGVVFFEILTGRLPFESESMEGWLYQHLHVKPPPPSKVKPELAQYPQLDNVVAWMMAKSPHERPKTAGDLGAVLRRMIDRKLAPEDAAGKPARVSGPRAALAFEDNPLPAKASGRRQAATFDPVVPPPRDGGVPAQAAAVPNLPTSSELEERRAAYLKHCRAAETEESRRHWDKAMEEWQKALPFAEKPDAVRQRIESCRREIDFESQLGTAGSAAAGGEWERAEQVLTRLSSMRPSDPRIEQARARLPRKLISAWLSMAKSRAEALPEGDLRSSLLERLAIAYAQVGEMQHALNTLQESSRKTEGRVVGLAHAIVSAVQNGQHEGMRPFIERASAAAAALNDPSDRGRALLEVGRALSVYGDQGAAAIAFQSALSAFSEANTKGIPMTVSAKKSNNSLRRVPVDMNRSMSITTTSVSQAKTIKASWENAVGVVAQSQAEAGLAEDSLASAAMIEDPWTVAQTLSQVAQALAKTGRSIEAERVAGQITFALPKTQALRAVAVSRVYRGDLEGAEEILKTMTNPADKVPIHGLLAAAWMLRNERSRADARIVEARRTVDEIVGARARCQALIAASEPLLNAGHQELVQSLLDDAVRLIDLIDDHAERLRSLLQIAQVQENAHSAQGASTRTVVFANPASPALIESLRRALVVWRQVRTGPDRFECVERLAYSIGCASTPVLATEMLSCCRDEAERALIYIGLSCGLS
jgi:tetratricopeptide (TPR) repeat protein